MPSVSDVWRAVFPHAVAFAEPPDREVGWVRVLKPRVPAFDALESTDLTIIPLGALTELVAAPVDAGSVVDAVAEAGGSAVLVVGATTDDALATEALERAAALGIGAFSLADGDPIALERSVIRYLVSGRAELERQARLLEQQLERIALDGGRSSGASHRVVRADNTPAYRLLHGVRDIPDGQRQARALLAPLLAGSAAKVDARLETLRAILDTQSLSAAATGLGLHRNTVAYRVKRIETMTGWDLDDPTVRFAVGLALRIVHSAQR